MIASLSPLLAWGLQRFGERRLLSSSDANLLPLSFRLRKNHVIRFEKHGALAAQLTRIDQLRPIRRIYVMGCGRSGTWLLTALMSTFKDTCVVSKEVPVEFFAKLTTNGRTLVLKRNNVSFRRFSQIPDRIKIVYAIRHPYDVLTSNNPTSERTYHIDSERWLGELAALRSTLEQGRHGICIIRYEDLVADARDVQRKLGENFGLEIGSSLKNLPAVFKASKEAELAMHGLRSIDARSLHRYKTDPIKIAYLKALKPQLEEMLDWASSRFDYDASLA